MNRVTAIGRLADDPALRSASSGKKVCSMRLAITRRPRGDEDQGAVFIDVARSERCARLAFTLADASGVAAAEAEVRHFDLRDRNADKILPLLPDQLSLRNVFLQVLLDLAPDDLPEAKVILFNV